MKEPIVPIQRASEGTIMALVKAGILEITEAGIRVKEKQDPPPTKVRDPTQSQQLCFHNAIFVLWQHSGKEKANET